MLFRIYFVVVVVIRFHALSTVFDAQADWAAHCL